MGAEAAWERTDEKRLYLECMRIKQTTANGCRVAQGSGADDERRMMGRQTEANVAGGEPLPVGSLS